MSQHETGSIRRLRGRRIDATVALAVALPLVALGAVALTTPDTSAPASQPPQSAPLESASLVCPAAAPGGDTVTTALGVSGSASVTAAGSSSSSQTALSAGKPQQLRVGPAAQILSFNGSGAPTLAASRWSPSPLAATECGPAVTGEWFTGLGAGPYHDSVIELTNPLSGDAVVDLDVFGAKGLVPSSQLQGVAVPAHGTVSFDLLHTIPRLDTLAVHATVVRGQAAISVRDHGRLLSGAHAVTDWVSGQAWPSTSNLLLGLLPQGGSNRLVVANPGNDQLDATLKLVTPSSVFEPAGAPKIQVPPQSVVTLSLDKLLHRPLAAGAFGIELDSTGPVTAELRRLAGADLTTTSAGPAVAAPASVVVPPGDKRLVVAGAKRAGALTVTSYDSGGHRLKTQRLTLTPQQGSMLTLPKGAVLVALTSDNNTAYVGSVVADTATGSAVLPVRSVPDSVRVPAVRPELH